MKHPRLSAIFAAVAATSILMVSTAGIAAQKSHENFKGENFKAEVPPPCPPIMMLHDGFYVGAGVGYDSYRFHNTTDFSEFDTSVSPQVLTESNSSSWNESATGWMGGLFVGYGHYFDYFYLGAEINASTSGANSTFTATGSDTSGTWSDSATIKVKARTSYGIAVLPGIKVNDSTLLYARLGYLRTNFKGSADFGELDGADVDTISGSTSNWINGFNYGVGIETYIAEDVSVRGEYTYTSYNSKSANATLVDAPDSVTFATNSKFKPSNNEFMLSLLYHFA